jgi:hypothetical protein
MSILHEAPPDSVIAYRAFILRHDPDVLSWTNTEVVEYSTFVTSVAEKVKQVGPNEWLIVVTTSESREERRFTSALDAASWLEQHPVTA